MRIVHSMPTLRLADGGVVRAVMDLCGGLAADGRDVTLITCDDTDAPPSWKSGMPGVPKVIKVARPSLPGGFFNGAQMREIEEHLRGAGVLHLHAMWTTSNPQIAKAAGRLGVPYVLSVHGMLDDWCMEQKKLKKAVYMALLARSMLNNAACIHCTAEFELAQARKHFDASRVRGEVIPLVFDLSAFRNAPGPAIARAKFNLPDDGVPTLLFLSRIHVKKGVDVLLRAAAELVKRGVNFRLAIAGTGDGAYEQEMKSLAASLGLQGDRARFLGLVTGDEKVSLYQAADVLLIPTSQENFGFVFVESLAAGTPLVTTKGVDTWPELEASGGATIIGRDPAEWASTVERLVKDRAAMRESGRRGREWALANLDSARTLTRFMEMYERAAGATGSAGRSLGVGEAGAPGKHGA